LRLISFQPDLTFHPLALTDNAQCSPCSVWSLYIVCRECALCDYLLFVSVACECRTVSCVEIFDPISHSVAITASAQCSVSFVRIFALGVCGGVMLNESVLFVNSYHSMMCGCGLLLFWHRCSISSHRTVSTQSERCTRKMCCARVVCLSRVCIVLDY
jgi:hypothetical protein